MWREVLTGNNHRVLSNFICQSFNSIIKFAEEKGIIQLNQNNIIVLNSVDVDDLSETCKLLSKRFEANFEHANGQKFLAPLGSVIQRYLFLDTSKLRPRFEQEAIKLWSYRCLQLEIICKQIGFARNVNSHNQNPLNDVGYAVMLAASVMRLQELFDAEETLLPQIEQLNLICNEILAVAVQATVVDASNNLGNNNAKLYPTDETELQESKNASDASLAKGQKTASKLEPVETIATADEYDLPIVSPETLPTREVKRQKLLSLRENLREQLRSQNLKVPRADYLLTEQIIRELTFAKIGCVEDIWKTPSLAYLYDYKQELMLQQFRIVETELLDILLQVND